ncbi:S8 family peptidase [Iningainema tapete]|uniref:S8 family peptidase n=1 Tax=Iningainema tapete BLCC-T55 TaxID=2748662 RepID=A0A8J6XHN1_9CYAN|nr:S8 family peptidase [Iningainema tapete]MBD2776094.1 S8 family peptidase [Iningainema tapete BLCC-T55]
MADKLDPYLWYLLSKRQSGESELLFSEIAEWVGLNHHKGQPSTIEVLVRCVDGDRSESLRSFGMDIHFEIQKPYTIASGKVTLDTLEKLNELDFVARVEASHPMLTELDISLTETSTVPIHENIPTVKGKGVIVGVIDFGIDYTHESFRNIDGTSRILYLWDQGAQYDPNGKVPYGREYTKAELDAALKTSNPLYKVRHLDRDGHGTHVAGIAVGNGRASKNRFTGIAPDADLIIVAFQEELPLNDSDQLFNLINLGRSARAFGALNYITQRAQAEGSPVVINLSMGSNIGGHAGETELEQFIDLLLRQPNIVVVKSAGNEQERLSHAAGNISSEQTQILEFEVYEGHPREELDVWYDGADKISVALQPPDSPTLELVSSDEIHEFFQTQTYNHIEVKFERNVEPSGDTRANIILYKGEADCIQPGIWKLLLQGDRVEVGRYDVWIGGGLRIQKNQFLLDYANESCKITVPGNGKRIITVGSYVTRPKLTSSSKGDISSFSCTGPTRYGLQKPEITAPGEWIISTRSNQSRIKRPAYPDRQHTLLAGTSMAAPHVTGAAALILSVRQDLTCEQVKQIFMQTARRDRFTCSEPDNTWGCGKLDVEAAVERARIAQFPQISNVEVNGAKLCWQTDIPTTAVVRFHTHQGKLQLGKALGEQKYSTLQTDHTLMLSGLSPGTYYCEIVAFSKDNWWTVDDNGDEFYVVEIVGS